MNEELKEYYEKIKDKMSEEEFLNEIEKRKEENSDISFIDNNDSAIADMIVGEYLNEKKF